MDTWKGPYIRVGLVALVIALLAWMPTREFLKLTFMVGIPFIFIFGFISSFIVYIFCNHIINMVEHGFFIITSVKIAAWANIAIRKWKNKKASSWERAKNSIISRAWHGSALVVPTNLWRISSNRT